GRRLAEEGARVLLGDVLDDLGEEHARALQAAGHDVRYLHLDVTDPAQWSAAVVAAGELDLPVNNAGIVRLAPAVQESGDGWPTPMSVKATGVFYGMRAAIPAMQRNGGGSIINIASIYGPVGAPGYVAYTASKGAVIAMTKVAALEHARDRIRVNAICPGPVRTPMSEEEGDASVDVTPLRRRAEPEEISAAVAFLASDDAVYVTGAELAVDGGYLARCRSGSAKRPARRPSSPRCGRRCGTAAARGRCRSGPFPRRGGPGSSGARPGWRRRSPAPARRRRCSGDGRPRDRAGSSRCRRRSG